jgi:hypothetical protein
MRVIELSNRADFQDMFVACTELSAEPAPQLEQVG